MDFVEICNVCTRNVIIKAAKRISNSDKICRSYCDFYFGVTSLEHSVVLSRERDFQLGMHQKPFVGRVLSSKAGRAHRATLPRTQSLTGSG